tara:strand:+ start:1906 stop:2403 length:498 start_codon:yes stop_codon:yes gene_type:complete
MMKNKALKILLIFSITFSFAQDYTPLNLSIKGMHCAGGCAKMIENSLNQNEGISAAVNFNTSSASIIYDKNIVSEVAIIDMINGYRSGKFVATNQNQLKSSTTNKSCSKGKNCCQKTGIENASCSSSETSSKKIFQRKRSKDKSLAGMIPGHAGCSKSCCSGKKK